MKTTIKNCKKDLLFIAICVNITRQNYAPVAQLDRVFGYEPKGRGFESLPAHQKSSCSFEQELFSFIFALRDAISPLARFCRVTFIFLQTSIY